MEKPDNTPNCVVELMASCWKANPNERPAFSFIERTLSSQLESTVTSYYLQLSDDYVKQNLERVNSLSSVNASYKFGRRFSRNTNRAMSRQVSTNIYVGNPCSPLPDRRKKRCVLGFIRHTASNRLTSNPSISLIS